jgi:hypothetical protein
MFDKDGVCLMIDLSLIQKTVRNEEQGLTLAGYEQMF